jgi:hypothetical protein
MAVNEKEMLKGIIEAGQKARYRMNEIEDAEKQQRLAHIEGCVFKLRNSYSCPDGDADYWWVYACAFKNADGDMRLFEFQTDKYGQVRIDPDEAYHESMEWKPIERGEYESAWVEMIKSIADKKPKVSK